MYPVFDNKSAFSSGGTNSFTVGSKTNQILVVFVFNNSVSAPTVTYNGVSVTFPYSPATNSTYSAYSPWVGYLVNPTTGTNNLISPAVYTEALVFHDVDQSTPFVGHQEFNGTGTTTSPRALSITTSYNHSVLLKSFWSTNTGPVSYSDGTGESGWAMHASEGTPRASYKFTQLTGSYSVTTSWSSGTQGNAQQVIELKGTTTSGAPSYGLVSNWKLDESSGTAIDSVGGNNATNTATTYGAAKINNGAIFNGSANLTSSSNVAISGTQPRTINLWAKAAIGYSGNALAGFGAANTGNAFEIALISNKFYFGGYSQDTDFGTAIVDSTFHMATAVFDGINLRLFTDAGNIVTAIPSLNTTDSTFRIGGNLFGLSDIVASCDEVTLYNRALTDAEVTYLYNSGAAFQMSKTFTATPTTGAYTLTGNTMSNLFVIGNAIMATGSYILTGFGLGTLLTELWTRQPKNSSSFTNSTKNTNTFINGTKSSSTWTDINKS